MHLMPIQTVPDANLKALFAPLAIFRSIQEHAPDEWQLILAASELYEAMPNEVVIRPGKEETDVFFLLKGELEVYPDSDSTLIEPIGKIMAGQILGEIAAICGVERQALVKVPAQGTPVVMLGMDYRCFGDLLDFSQISLTTKLDFYRQTVNHTRWRIEMFRIRFPHHQLSRQTNKLEIFRGEKNSVEELQSLHRQMQQMAVVLKMWNQEALELLIEQS